MIRYRMVNLKQIRRFNAQLLVTRGYLYYSVQYTVSYITQQTFGVTQRYYINEIKLFQLVCEELEPY